MSFLSTSNGKTPSELKARLAILLKDYFHEQRNPYNQSMLIKNHIEIEQVCYPISQMEESAAPSLNKEKMFCFREEERPGLQCWLNWLFTNANTIKRRPFRSTAPGESFSFLSSIISAMTWSMQKHHLTKVNVKWRLQKSCYLQGIY